MGLIKAIGGAINGVMADQWKEYYYCDSLPEDVLVRKGRKKVSGKFGTKNDGNDNIITNGSVIAVNEGQCMIIVDQGKVAEFCAEAGEFLYDTSTEPSLLHGNLGENIGKTFAQIGRRFTFGGDVGKDQRVYYFNTKEIMGNKYGTAKPIPFRIVDNKIGLDMDVSIRCNGEYSYMIFDPLLFYTNVCGNIPDDYLREKMDSQLKTELLTVLPPALAQISAMGIRYNEVSAHTQEIADALNEQLSEKWGNQRGIRVVSCGIHISLPEEDEKMIKDLQRTAVFTNTNMAAANLASAQADAMKAAASNTSAGPMMAFAGMNMANMAGGMNAGNLFAMGQQQQQQTPPPTPPSQGQPSAAAAPAADAWTCSCGHAGNTGKYCMECGKSKDGEQAGWTCSCGKINLGKFCSDCGAKKPEGAPLYRCDKCGWTPEDPHNPPKFCPECGDIFDENDIQ